MKCLTLVSCCFLLCCLHLTSADGSKKPGKTRLSKVRSLTLRAGKPTTARRVDPIPQLHCVGGNAAGMYEPDVMRCTNQGSEYDEEDIQWTCTASLPEEFKLGSTDVICEGYNDPDDPFVLKGSCGVEYTLMLTEKGERKYARRRDENEEKRTRAKDAPKREEDELSGSGKGNDHVEADKDTPATVFVILFWVAFAVVAFIIITKFLEQLSNSRPRDPPRSNSNSGGRPPPPSPPPPPPPYDDAPPPYTDAAQPSKKKPDSQPSSSQQQQQTQESWGPGFYTGMGTGAAAGAAAGYMAGRRGAQQDVRERRRDGGQTEDWRRAAEREEEERLRRRRQDEEDRMRRRRQEEEDRMRQDRMVQERRRQTMEEEERMRHGFSTLSDSNSGRYSSTRYESSGFGGTRRR